MTRSECEEKIIEEFEKIVEIYHQYHPLGNYLDVTYINTYSACFINAYNAHWPGGEDAERAINASKYLETGECR